MKKRLITNDSAFPAPWYPVLQSKARPPVCIALGSPRQLVELVRTVPLQEPVAFQMDLHQAEKIRESFKEHNLSGTVTTHADLWDVGSEFQTVIFPVEPHGERVLKLDIIEQAYHILRPGGTLIVLSRHEKEQFFPAALKKIYGKVHTPEQGDGGILWCQRGEDRPRRRHEVTFQVSNDEGPSLRFLSRPGVFSYGRFDNGARALVEIAVINPGDRILDYGCGCGTNGIICGLRAGPAGHVTFVDSHCRATVLTELNARSNGLTSFDVKTCCGLDGFKQRAFDVVLANPPYYANLTIAEKFVKESRPLLKPGGRLYLVTKQPAQVGPMMAEEFGTVEAVERRGYVVLCATAE